MSTNFILELNEHNGNDYDEHHEFDHGYDHDHHYDLKERIDYDRHEMEIDSHDLHSKVNLLKEVLDHNVSEESLVVLTKLLGKNQLVGLESYQGHAYQASVEGIIDSIKETFSSLFSNISKFMDNSINFIMGLFNKNAQRKKLIQKTLDEVKNGPDFESKEVDWSQVKNGEKDRAYFNDQFSTSAPVDDKLIMKIIHGTDESIKSSIQMWKDYETTLANVPNAIDDIQSKGNADIEKVVDIAITPNFKVAQVMDDGRIFFKYEFADGEDKLLFGNKGIGIFVNPDELSKTQVLRATLNSKEEHPENRQFRTLSKDESIKALEALLKLYEDAEPIPRELKDGRKYLKDASKGLKKELKASHPDVKTGFFSKVAKELANLIKTLTTTTLSAIKNVLKITDEGSQAVIRYVMMSKLDTE